MTFPIFLPLLAMSYGISGSLIGLILCTPALTSLVAVPLLDRYVIQMGIELVICMAGLFFGLAFLLMGFGTFFDTDNSSGFLWLAIAISVIIGFCNASSIVGEQALLLRYSIKSEREKNLGMFRAASGLGGLLSPLMGSAMFAWGSYTAVFMYVGVGYLLIAPLIYRQLYRARDAFNAQI